MVEDIHAYTAARLASNTITYEQVGPKMDSEQIVMLPSMDAYKDETHEENYVA